VVAGGEAGGHCGEVSTMVLIPEVHRAVQAMGATTPILAAGGITTGTQMAAAMSMDYPRDKLTVWLLDDGGTDQKCNDANPAKAEAARQRRAVLSSLCAQMGAQYLTRARNEHAKAGNLNNGLTQSQGEIVVVFDADHAPFRSFLRETIGHFARDPKLFLVQTPHVFLNPDPIEKNLRTFDRMPSENEMFYSSIQRGLDKWNGSFFCGSAALLRRSALATVGGFSGITITEDCETALDLHSQGWTSVFVDKPLIAGLQPETFASFIGQRSRWCQGMMQIFLLKNPIFKQGLRPIQKAAYLSSMTFWLFPMPRLVFMLAPLLFILLDIKVFVSNLD
jgi:cellulose synthase (UDP-forming)